MTNKKTKPKKVEVQIHKIGENGKLIKLTPPKKGSKTAQEHIIEIVAKTQKKVQQHTGTTQDKLTASYNKILKASGANAYNKITDPHNRLKKAVQEALEDYNRQEKELKKFPLYHEIIRELENEKLKTSNTIAEINTIKKVFYEMHNKINKIEIEQPQLTKQTYSLECNFAPSKINLILAPHFKHLFDCENEQIINLLSEKIETEIHAKKETPLKDIICFFDLLKANNIIKTGQVVNVLAKTKCIIFKNKPLTARQLLDARKEIKKYSYSQTNELFFTELDFNEK